MEFLAFALFLVYLAPWIVAEARGHPRPSGVLVLTLLAGWTGIGWGIAWHRALRAEEPGPAGRDAPRLRALEGGGGGGRPAREATSRPRSW